MRIYYGYCGFIDYIIDPNIEIPENLKDKLTDPNKKLFHVIICEYIRDPETSERIHLKTYPGYLYHNMYGLAGTGILMDLDGQILDEYFA